MIDKGVYIDPIFIQLESFTFRVTRDFVCLPAAMAAKQIKEEYENAAITAVAETAPESVLSIFRHTLVW